MKEFTEFRTELNEGIEDLVEHVTMPPNILILRRKTVRQFPDGVMVALYYNDKLGLQFSIPYGPTQNPVVTPVGLEESHDLSEEEQENEDKAWQHSVLLKKHGFKYDEEAANLQHPRNQYGVNHFTHPGGHTASVNREKGTWKHKFVQGNRYYPDSGRSHEELGALLQHHHGKTVKEESEKTAPQLQDMGIPDYKAPMGIDKNKAPMGIPTRTKWHYGKQPQVLDLQNLDEISMNLKEDDEYLSHSTSRAGKAAQKSSWMANFEKHVVKTNPAHSGKINWNDAHYHHKQGTSPESAARKYTDSNPTPHESHFHRESEELNEGAADDKRQEQQKTLWAKRQKRCVWLYGAKQAKIQADMKTAGSKRDYDDHYMEEAAEHGVIQRLRNIKDFHAIKHITHADGTKTHVDPTTAHALLTVHDALKPEGQAKFVQHLEHSKPKFHKMLDFTWKNVK